MRHRGGSSLGRRLGAVVALAVLAAGCSDGDASSSTTRRSTTSSTTTKTQATDDPRWAEIDRELAGLAPNVGFLAAEVTPGGNCRPVHAVAPSTPRPTASQFKLFVLGALAEEIAAGRIAWDQELTVTEEVKSLGNAAGSLQEEPVGTKVTVEHAATTMISISDNTATDMLIELVGRDLVEDKAAEWTGDRAANTPFLMTREMFLLHYVPGLGDRWLETPADGRAAFLASEVTPRPRGDIGAGYSTDPRYVDRIEWFAGPDDLCGAFAGLQELAQDPALEPLSTVMSLQDVGLDLPADTWPTVWYKGGSESGVLTLGWLATNRDGRTFVVEAMVSNADEALADDSIDDLIDLGRRAFGLVA